MKPIFRQALSALAFLLLLPFAAFAQPTPPSGEVIGYWGFDSTNLPTAYGLLPLTASNLALVPDWSGNALQVDATNAGRLVYPVATALANGKIATNITFSAGSIEFWFAPNWDSGTGPGCWGRLLEVADPAAPTNLASAWGLYVSPDGTGLYFSARTNALRTNFAAASISWNYGEWHYLIAAYDASTNGVALYLDGQLAASNPNGMTVLPTTAAISNGFTLGSDLATGMKQMHGQMDELWAYDYALDAVTVSNNYAWLAQFVYPLPSTRRGFGTMDAPSFPVDGGDDGGDDGSTNTVPPWNPAVMFAADFRLGVAPPGTNAWNPYDPNGIVIILNQTTNTSVYQLWSTTNLVPPVSWTIEQTVLGNPATNWTAFIVDVGTNAQKFYTAINYTQDTDGGGLPDWWQMKYFGHLGNDPYGDPMGDGYSNLYKFQNGMNPNVAYQPPAPAAFTAALNTNGNIILTWPAVGNLPSSPGAGTLSNYTLAINSNYYLPATNLSLSAGTTNYTLNSSSAPGLFDYLSDYFAVYGQDTNFGKAPSLNFQANFASAVSQAVTNQFPFDAACSVNATVVRGPQGALYLLASAVPANVVAIRVIVQGGGLSFPMDSWMSDALDLGTTAYYPESYSPGFSYGTFLGLNYFDAPVASLTNGVYQIPPAQAPLFAGYNLLLLGVGANGNLGYPSYGGRTNDLLSASGFAINSIPFLDGRTAIQQNISVLLRGADGSFPYNIMVDGAFPYANLIATNFVYAGYCFEGYGASNNLFPQRNEFQPFEDNSLYAYLVFNPANFDGAGNPLNGAYDYFGSPDVDNAANFFSASNYAAHNTNFPMTTVSIMTGAQSTNATLLAGNLDGAVMDPPAFTVPANLTNLYGLPVSSLLYWGTNGAYDTALPGHAYPFNDDNSPLLFQQAQAPGLQTVGYYFARPGIDPLPPDTNFTVASATPSPIIIPFGQPFFLTAWAKQAVTNGYTNVFAYAQQYFDKAYLGDGNGNATTNQTGILSEYGEFFPTEPGQVILTTKPDGATGTTGQCVLYVVKLQLDVNHDGTMDTSFAGPDNTSSGSAFRFWINNDCDAPSSGDYPDRDIDIGGDPGDADSVSGKINSQRDLEDYARLWICGLPALTNEGAQVSLSWANIASGTPCIKLFNAVETNGGMAYLTNSTVAGNQATILLGSGYAYNTYPGPGTSIGTVSNNFTFPAGSFTNNAAKYLLFEGASVGKGQLVLTVAQNGTILASTSAFMDLHDIKTLYERAVARNVTEGLPPSSLVSTDQIVNLLPADATEAKQLILFVHGMNQTQFQYENTSETMFKRLYWAGFRGRFAAFRWPCGYLPPRNNTYYAYDLSEFYA